MKLTVDTDQFVRRMSGQISGPIYFEFADGSFFPEQGWFDFPITIMSWWSRDLALASGEFDLSFMEGNCRLRVSSEPGSPSKIIPFWGSLPEGHQDKGYAIDLESFKELTVGAWEQISTYPSLDDEERRMVTTCIGLLTEN